MAKGRFYTKDYTGEYVSVGSEWKNKSNPDHMHWVEKTIINDDHDNIAHVIGNGTSRSGIDLRLLKGQVGGAKVRSVGQTYGCNNLYKDFNPTFLITTNTTICNNIAASGYPEQNIVFTNVKNIINYPQHFHLYPKLAMGSAGSAAIRLACADGHTTIFLLGMNGYSYETDNVYYGDETYARYDNYEGINKKLVHTNINIFKEYSDVKFYFVKPLDSHYDEAYKWLKNVKPITKREYFSIAQLGAIAN